MWQACRVRAATSPDRRSRRRIRRASGSGSCATRFQGCGGSRFSSTRTILPPSSRQASFRARPTRSASRSCGGDCQPGDIAPAIEGVKGRVDALYLCTDFVREQQPRRHQRFGARGEAAYHAGLPRRDAGRRPHVLRGELPRPVPPRRREGRHDPARREARAIFRSSSRASSTSSSTSRPPRRSASPCRRRSSLPLRR